MKILVTGGAGYIGSHMAHTLLEKGYEVIILDNLITGYKEVIQGFSHYRVNLLDSASLEKVFQENAFDAVVHFAGLIQVGESVLQPAKYYENNVVGTVNLLESMRRYQVRKLIFSSSAAVYGQPEYCPIDEMHPKNPINPYGRTKWMVEEILDDYDHAYQLRSIRLRYFNAAGADPAGQNGWRNPMDSHLIPNAMQVALGRQKELHVFGTDYDTADGTCIRDYVHVTDLCQAHLLALEALAGDHISGAYNLGLGQGGFSVLQVIEAAKRLTGKPIPVQFLPRREGDPAVLVADSSQAQQELHWQPKFSSLDLIIQHSWAWAKSIWA